VTAPLLGTPITLVKRQAGDAPLVDDYNVEVWTAGTSVEVLGAVDPGSTTIDLDGRVQITVTPTAYLPAGTDVTDVYRLEVAGDVYELASLPAGWVNPYTGDDGGIVLRLKKVTG
jgi:hypothetical protein